MAGSTKPTSLGPLGDSERLGRYIIYKTAANKAKKGKFLLDRIVMAIGPTDFSYDRLDHAPLQVMEILGIKYAKANQKPFFGWYVIKVGAARGEGRTIHPDPIPGNPYHSYVRLGDGSANMEKRERDRHANELSVKPKMTWLPAPNAPAIT